jgi:hypothetical protein
LYDNDNIIASIDMFIKLLEINQSTI